MAGELQSKIFHADLESKNLQSNILILNTRAPCFPQDAKLVIGSSYSEGFY